MKKEGIKCAKCNKDIFYIILLDVRVGEYQYQIKCANCGNEAYMFKNSDDVWLG